MATVTITQGKLKGNEAVTVNGLKYFEFLNIPYAKPPVGDLRFKVRQKNNCLESYLLIGVHVPKPRFS